MNASLIVLCLYIFRRVVVCVVMLSCVVLAQPPPRPPGPGGPAPAVPAGPPPPPGGSQIGIAGPPPPGGPPGPVDPNAPAGANPWHELLQRMMELMQTAAGMETGPGGAVPDPNAMMGAAGGPAPAGSGPVVGGPSAPGGPPKQVEYQVAPAGPGGPGGPAAPSGPVGGHVGIGGPHGPGPMSMMPSGPGGPPSKGGPPKPPSQPKAAAPQIPDCFWEGKFYRPGSDIVRGQHDRWCYVTYCDSNGNIQFWDDYNCPPNSMKPTSGHNTGRPTPPQATSPRGCTHNNIAYEPGQEISSSQVGERCHGSYCSHDGQIIQWEDWCATQPPKAPNPIGGGVMGQVLPGANPPMPQQAQPTPAMPIVRPVSHPIAPPQAPAQFAPAQPPQAAPAPPRKTARRGPKQGCYHNNLYYQPNEDVIVGNIGDMCYGYYCEGDNVFVHWEDRCANANVGAAAPVTASMPGGMTGAMNTGLTATAAPGGFWI